MVSLRLRLRILFFGLLLGLACIALWMIVGRFQPAMQIYATLDGAIYDIFFRLKPKIAAFDTLIIIDVKDQRGEMARAAEMTRGDYARLIEKVANAGAKVIGLDMVFAENRDSASDDSLAKIANQYSQKLVFAFEFVKNQTSANESALHRHNLTATLPRPPESWENFFTAEGVELPLDSLLADSSIGLGHVTYYKEYDNVIRRFPMVIKYRHEGFYFYPALALEMVKGYLGASYEIPEGGKQLILRKKSGAPLAVPLDEDGAVLINLIPNPEKIFKPYLRATLPEHFGDNFEGAIVLIVNSAPAKELTSETPLLEDYPMWAFHASLISQILEQSFIRYDPKDTVLWSEIFILLCMIWLVEIEYRLNPRKRKPWIVMLSMNLLFLFFTFLMLCLGLRLLVILSLLMLNATYVVMRTHFKTLVTMPSYLDIELLVSKAENEKYPVTVTRSPMGGGSGSFEAFLKEPRFREALEKIRSRNVTKHDLAYVGSKLFQALFPEKVQRIYDRCRGEAEKEKKNLRLQLCLAADELANLPWELLQDAELREGFLALSKRVPLSITRRYQVAGNPNSSKLRLPLKILVMISSPIELPGLKVDIERSEIKKALRDLIWLRDIDIEFTEKATPEELEKHLNDGIHVFHYIGHSAFNAQTQEGMLALETEDDRLNWVEAERVAILLQKTEVQMVILNSCDSAKAAEVDAFAGVSQKLINAGIPAVIAMQFPIADASAILFSKAFYKSFVLHFSIDKAVADARRAIMANAGVWEIDWATPVLTMSEPEGIVLARQTSRF